MDSRQSRKRSQLEDQYREDLAELDKQEQGINERLNRFTRETDQLVDQVLYLTRDDDWDKREFYQEMADTNDEVRDLARRSLTQLEDERDEVTRTYRKKLLDLEAEEAEEKPKKQDK